MCNALFDLQAEVADTVPGQVGLAKGGMFLLSHEEQSAIVPRVYGDLVNSAAGGSGANTAIGVALLGGTASFTSRIGDDEHGRRYREGLRAQGVQPFLASGDVGTGISLILVTPDAQRTMGTYLGAAQELRKEDVDADAIAASRFLYVTGYLWDTPTQQEAVLFAMEQARAAGVPITLSLSDTFCVERHHADFVDLLFRYVDVVFANAAEAVALTGAADIDQAIQRLAGGLKPEGLQIAAVTRDAQGSIVQQNQTRHEIPAYPVTAIDTTGAGDMYAAGFLYGLAHDLPLAAAGRIASYASARVVALMGPRLDAIDRETMQSFVNGTADGERDALGTGFA